MENKKLNSLITRLNAYRYAHNTPNGTLPVLSDVLRLLTDYIDSQEVTDAVQGLDFDGEVEKISDELDELRDKYEELENEYDALKERQQHMTETTTSTAVQQSTACEVICIHEPPRRVSTAPDDWFFPGKQYKGIRCIHTSRGIAYYRVYRSQYFYEIFEPKLFDECFRIVETPDPFGI